MPFKYRSKREQRATFMDVQRADGSTVELDPGEIFISVRRVDHPDLELVETKSPEEVTNDVSVVPIKTPARPARKQ